MANARAMASWSEPGLSTMRSALMSLSEPMFPLDRMSSVGMAPSDAAALAAAAVIGSPGLRSPTAPRRICLDAGSMAASAER